MALIIRLLIIKFGPRPADDDGIYLNAALNFLNGQGLSYVSRIHGPNFLLQSWLPPVYGIVLVLYCKVFPIGFTLFPLRILITLLGCGSCVVMYFLGRHLKDKKFGVFAGYALAFYLPQALDSTALNPFPIASFIFICMVYLLVMSVESAGNFLIFFAGLLSGITALTRGEYFTTNLWILVWLFFLRTNWAREKWIKRGLVSCCLFLLGLGLAMSPWIIRNYVIHRQLIVLSTNYGDNFYFTFNPGYRFSGDANYYDLPRLQAQAKDMNETQTAQFLFHEGLKYIRENPGRFVKTVALNFFHFWKPFLSTEKYSLAQSLAYAVFYLPVFLLFLLGLFHVRWKEHSGWGLIVGIIIIKSMSHLLFYIIGRFRETLVPYMIFFAVQGLLFLIWKMKQKLGNLIPAPESREVT